MIQTKEDLIRQYNETAAECDRKADARRPWGKVFVVIDLLLFAAVVALLVYGFKTDALTNWLVEAIFALAFAWGVVRFIDIRNDSKITEYNYLKQTALTEVDYLNGKYASFDEGEEYVDASHPFTFDLDVFGKGSLFQRISRTITSGGSDLLAEQLSTLQCPGTQNEALAELAANNDFLLKFKSIKLFYGKANTKKTLQSLEQVRESKIPAFFHSKLAIVLGIAMLAGMYITMGLLLFSVIGYQLPLWWAIAQLSVVAMACNKPLKLVHRKVEYAGKNLIVFSKIIKLVSKAQFSCEPLNKLQQQIQPGVGILTQLDLLLNYLNSRGNVLGTIAMNLLVLADWFELIRIYHINKRYGKSLDECIKSISYLDALVTMATMRRNHPEATVAEITNDKGIVYEAKALYHPFLGSKAVKNDFSMADRNFYIITGANMAGKSTFLRTIGINYVLAMLGMPVFASSFRVSHFSLFSSMRTQDDLNKGISYFNAELLRLEQLLDFVQQHGSTLIILDEILKGTNSADKLSGSRMFLEAVSQLPVTGIIATHDLKLSEMENEYPGRFHNYCFEIALGEKCTYSYKITQGVARNQNATYLLRQILDKKLNK